MSTAARKARKRQRHDDLALFHALASRGLPTDTVYVHPKFQHPRRTGTPVAQRAATIRTAEKKLGPGMIARIAAAVAKRGWGSR